MSVNWQVDGFTEIRELGAGAQGRVVLARHPSGTPVAIKYLNRRDGDEAEIERLRNEAVMLGRVTDPHVVRLYRFVLSEHGAALVMEAVNGVSLKEILARHGALGPEASLTVLKGSLLGLAAAHGVGVVHRDYKPANVVVQGDGLSKLVDFGIAAPAGEDSRSGTPVYMAPEQWLGRPASPATDVYAATCVFFECVTGRRPYGGAGEGLGALREGHLNGEIPVEEVPGPLRDLLRRGMAKSADERPPGAAAFVAELEEAASAAYGPGWEQRGVRAMAGTAVALAALFPLVAAGLVPSAGVAGAAAASGVASGAAASGAAAAGTAGTAVGGAAASGTAASGAAASGAAVSGTAAGTAAGGAAAGGGTAGGVAAGATAAGTGTAAGAGTGTAVGAGTAGGLLATAGAKIAATVVATTVAAGGVGVYAGTRDEGPARTTPALVPVAARVVSANLPAGGGSAAASQQFVTVSGHRDKAVERRVNAALRAASDRELATYRKEFGGRSDVQEVTSTAHVTLNTPRLLSVSYSFGVAPAPGTMGNWVKNFTSEATVVIDLATGKTLGAADLFTPAALTPAGLVRLANRITPYDPRDCLAPGPVPGEPSKPFRFGVADLQRSGSPIQIALLPRKIRFEIAVERLDMTMAGMVCQVTNAEVPADKLADMMAPDVLKEVRAATPTPTPGPS